MTEAEALSPAAPTADEDKRATKPSRPTRAELTSTDAPVILGILAIASIGTLLVRPSPTGIGWWDAVLTFAFVLLVVFAGSRGSLATLGWIAAVAVLATALTNPTIWILFGLLGFIIAWFAGAGRSTSLPSAVLGAAASSLALLALFRLAESGSWGTPSLLTATAVLPLFITAIGSLNERERDIARKAMKIVAAALAICGLSLVATAALAQGPARSARNATERAIDALNAGNTADAAAQLNLAALALDDAERATNSFISAPARLLPVVSQHLSVGGSGLRHGAELAGAAATGADALDLDELRNRTGGMNVDQVRTLVTAANKLDEALQPAASELGAISNDWLIPPVADLTRSGSADLVDAARISREFRPLLQVAPELLGADKPIRYFVLFATPAEARELGGLLGAYAVVEIDDGQINLLETGNNTDLIERARRENLELDLNGYSEFFVEIYEPETYAQNFTGIPDLTFAAEAIQDVFGTFAGAPLDGVIYLDPFAVQAIVGVTGPLEVDGLPLRLNGQTTADFLLRGQYEQFENQDERKDFLVSMLDQTFSSLLTIDFDNPRQAINRLAPVIRSGRLQVTMFDADINERLARTDLLRRWPENTGADFLSILQSNAAPTKLDAYLQRSWEYDLSFDPETGAANGTLALTLTSTATADLPNYVTAAGEEVPGSEQRRPQDNWTFASLITPLIASEPLVNNVPQDRIAFNELGYQRLVARASVTPEQPVTIVWQVSGNLTPGDYTLRIAHQPLVNNDRIRVTITPTDGWLLSGFDSITWSFGLDQNVTLVADARPR